MPSRCNLEKVICFDSVIGYSRVQTAGTPKPATMMIVKIAIGMMRPGVEKPTAMTTRKPRYRPTVAA
jgi:hypothetical protein